MCICSRTIFKTFWYGFATVIFETVFKKPKFWLNYVKIAKFQRSSRIIPGNHNFMLLFSWTKTYYFSPAVWCNGFSQIHDIYAWKLWYKKLSTHHLFKIKQHKV